MEVRRFMSREEWPLVAAGVMVGVLTSALILYLFFTGIDGGGVDPSLVADPELGRIERPDPAAPGPEGPGRGVIGLRERGISDRLARLRLTARPMRGPLAITLRNLVWTDPDGVRWARAESATGQLSTAALGRGDVVLDNVVVRRPVIALRQTAPGADWNYQEVFAELLEPDDSPGPQRTIHVRNLRIVDGSVDVTRPGQQMAFRSVQARMPLVVLSQPGVPEPYIRIAQLTTQFSQPEPEARLALAVSDALVSFPTGLVRFDVGAATLDRTQLADVRGVFDPGQPGYGITAEGRALSVRFEDVGFALPEAFPATGEASFGFAVRPLPGDRTEATLTELDARSDGSRVLGSMTVQFGEEFFALVAADLRLDPLQLALVEGFTGPLPWGGTVAGSVRGTGGDIGFDLAAALTAPTVAAPFNIGLAGGFLVTPDGLLLQRLVADLDRVPIAALRAAMPGLPLDGVVTGRVAVQGAPDASPLQLDVRLEVGAGVVVTEGTVDLTGAVPRYDLTGRLIGVNLRTVLSPEFPPVALTSSFALRGAGFDPATMNATVNLSGTFMGWEAAPGDTVGLAASIGGGALQVHSLVATLATADVRASGTWRFIEPQSGSIVYDVAVTSLRPWGPYLPVIGDPVATGSLFAVGTLSGSLERMRLTGGATGTRLQVGEWRAASLVTEYEAELGGGTLPVLVLDATATGIGTPTAGDFPSARAAVRLTPPTLVFDVAATRPGGRLVELAGTGLLPEDGVREVVVQRARFDLEQGQWLLVQPATISWVGDDVIVRHLELRDTQSEGRVLIDGQLRPPVGIAARIQLAAIPTGEIQRLLGQPARLEGQLWADAELRGALDDPLVEITFRVEDGAIADVPVRQLQGSVLYRDREAVVEAVALVQPDGRLELSARLPAILQFEGTPMFAFIDGVPLTGSLRAEQFALAPLAVFFPDVRDMTGVVNAQVNLAGTADAPVVDGTARLDGGAATILPLNQRYDQITGELAFDDRRLVVRDFRARSDGWVVAGGQILLQRVDEPVLDLEFTLDGFRPIGVENQRDAATFGRLTLRGPPDALELTGSLRVDDGYVVIPQMGGPTVDVFDITRPAPVIGQPTAPAADAGIMAGLRVRNLQVSAGDAAWFIVDEARAQMSGTLVVNRDGANMPIVGTLTGTRGQYTLIAGPIVRRFDIVAAQVRFLGSPQPNPAIDITARRIVFDPGGRELAVDVRITGTLESPRLALAGGEAVDIAEPELLSLLLFGQPTFALGGEFIVGDDLLQQTLGGALAEVIAIELERGLGGRGLDIFQIRLGQGPVGGLANPTVVMGHQLRQDVFLTVEAGITALMGGAGTGNDSRLATWAVRLDWAFDPRSRLRLAWEPAFAGRSLRRAALALPLTPPRQQLLAELRRRWTY
jgi:hypothetical protein